MPILNPPASIQAAAERGLRSSPYSALKHVSCDCQGGVLVLRGRLPTYFLKQIAQEAVAQQFDRGGATGESDRSRPGRFLLTPVWVRQIGPATTTRAAGSPSPFGPVPL